MRVKVGDVGLYFDVVGMGPGRIRCPTLILAKEHDQVTSVADHEEMAAAIPGSRLRVFADAGHGVFRDKPVEALRAILEFILPEAEDRPREPPPVSVSAVARPQHCP
jgi:pimeloyl-ACP methyl ester carboxylesterase